MGGPFVWRVEEACFNAFPALKHVILEGWLLRFSDGRPRRTNNSVSPMRADCSNVVAVIDAIETLYQRNGVQTLFRVPAFMPEAFDESLAAHGYGREEDSCVIYGDIAAIEVVPDAHVELSPSANMEWLAAMGDLQGYSQEQRSTYQRVIGAIALPTAFAGLRIDGKLVSLAYGVIDNGLLSYESVITHQANRRLGFSRRIMGAVAAWAREQGAEGACLQVATSNTSARTLYDRFGLTTELYRYHYRRAGGQ